MDNINYFKGFFESILDFKKTVLIMFLIKIDKDLLKVFGLLKNDIIRLCLEFKNILMEQNAEYLEYIKNEEESVIETILEK